MSSCLSPLLTTTPPHKQRNNLCLYSVFCTPCPFPFLYVCTAPLNGSQESQLAGGPTPSAPQLPGETPHPTAVQVGQNDGRKQSGRRMVEDEVKGNEVVVERMQTELTQARMVRAAGWTSSPYKGPQGLL